MAPLLTASLKTLFVRPIFKELSWYTVAQVFVQGASFISAIVVSRYLGPTNLGLYSFVLNYVGAFLTVIGGMDFYFTWKLANSGNREAELQKYIGHKFNVYVAIALVGLACAWWILPGDVAFMASIMLLTVAFQSLNAFLIYAVVHNRAKLVALVQILSAWMLLGIKVLLVAFNANLVWFVGVSAVDLILSGILFSLYFLRRPEWRGYVAGFSLPSLVSSASFLFSIRLSIASLVFWQLLLRVDQLLLATISNAYTLGIYSAAVKISDIPNFLSGILSMALTSRIASLAQENTLPSRERVRTIMWYYAGAGALMTLLFLVAAPLVVSILYGGRFADSVPVLRAYSLSIPAMFLLSFFTSMYGARNRYHAQVAIFFLALVANVVLVYILTPLYGVVGTAYATVLAYSLAALLFYLRLK